MNRNSCETCALTASLPQVEKEDDLRGEKIAKKEQRPLSNLIRLILTKWIKEHKETKSNAHA